MPDSDGATRSERDPDTAHRRYRRSAVVAVAVGAVVAALALAGVSLLRPSRDDVRAATAVADASPAAASPTPAEVRAPWEPGAPRRLSIPALGVDAPVVPVRAPGRNLVPPRDPAQLGWWADGVRPGARRGAALLAGHTVHGAARGALDDLERLRRGDEVAVRTGRSTLTYVVTRVRIFTKGELARHAERLFDQHAAHRLVVVTCEDWDGTRFLSNVVVTARPGTA